MKFKDIADEKTGERFVLAFNSDGFLIDLQPLDKMDRSVEKTLVDKARRAA